MLCLSRGHFIGALLGFVLYYSSVLLYHNTMPSFQLFTDHYNFKYKSMAAQASSRLIDRQSIHLRPSHETMLNDSSHTRPRTEVTQNLNKISSEVAVTSMKSDHQYEKVVSTQPIENILMTPINSPSIDVPVSSQDPNKNECMEMKTKYLVEPGLSWGSLPVELQRTWTKLLCDTHVLEIEDTLDIKLIESKVEHPIPIIKPPPGSRLAKNQGVGLMKISDDYKEWCNEAKEKYNVQPMKSWGRLPGNMVDIWKSRRCDMVFTVNRMERRPLSTCAVSDNKVNSKDQKSQGFMKDLLKSHPNMNQSLPLIAIMAATTTRRVHKPSTDNMALFMYLLPSLTRSLDCGFRYEYVLGYDSGDPFYDTKEGMDKTKKWFQINVEDPMKANAIQVKLRTVKVNNSLKKPGPVFVEMARAAYKNGATYFYRINDDTELLSNWPRIFVNALNGLSFPYGVVGPMCRQGNEQILTHDFVHRVHMEIFEMNYYPPELTDWWMDDWISYVYGIKRTYKATRTPVLHHTGAHGQRYEVDRENERLLGKLIDQGHTKIRNYMLKHEIPEEKLLEFDKAIYKRFVHNDVPENIYSSK